MKKISELQTNIWKYFVAIAISNIWLTMPISILYLQTFNISLTQIGLLFAIQTIIIIILNVPVGAFTDFIGKKWALFLGCILWSLGLYVIGTGNIFQFFLFGFILNGLSEVMFSGAYTSIIYDTLKAMDEEENFLKLNSKLIFVNSFMLIFGNILGIFLYQLNIRLPFLIFSVVILISGIFLAFMKEPFKFDKNFSWKNHIKHIKNSFKYTLLNKRLRFLIFFSIVLSIPMLIFLELIEQVYLINLGFSISSLGFIFAFTRGIMGLFTKSIHKIENKLGEKNSLYSISILYGIIFILLGIINSIFMIFLLILLFFFRSYKITLMDNYIHKSTESYHRAAIISINNFLLNSLYSISLIVAGISLTIININTLLIGFGIGTLTVSVPLLKIYYS